MSLTPNCDLARERFQIRREEEIRSSFNIKFPILLLALAGETKNTPEYSKLKQYISLEMTMNKLRAAT
jgi:hypothetical protein